MGSITGIVESAGRYGSVGRSYRHTNIRNEFLSTPEFHSWPIKKIMRHYGVGASFAQQLRHDAGVPNWHDQKKLIRQRVLDHPDLGEPGWFASVPAEHIAQEIGCGKTIVSNIRKQLGIIYCRRELEDHSPYSPLFDAWMRPEGIQEHLDALADNQTRP